MADSAVSGLAKLPELRKRVLFTLLMLAVYRIGVFVPTPGVDASVIERLLSGGTFFGMFNLFSGGAFKNFSVFALGIMPYVSASIILQLLTISIPSLEKLSKEGEYGRKIITRYTRYGTVILSLIQGFGISYGLVSQGAVLPGVTGLPFYLTTMITLAAGTAFIMWLGEQIAERGIGNGISLIIFSGIVAELPSALRVAWETKEQLKPLGGLLGFVFLLALIFGIIYLIIFFERSQRKIPVQYAKRIIGKKLYGGQSTHLPLKLNMAGVIPPIFASSLILFPATLAQFWQTPVVKKISDMLTHGWLHNVLYVFLIVFFCYFYTAVTFNPVDVSDNLKKQGGFIPGIRPGKSTSDFIDRILSRLTLGGAIYIAAVCLLPTLLMAEFGVPPGLASAFGGTSLLIVVGVAMDTVAQIESHLLTRNYDGFLGERAGKFKGRRG